MALCRQARESDAAIRIRFSEGHERLLPLVLRNKKGEAMNTITTEQTPAGWRATINNGRVTFTGEGATEIQALEAVAEKIKEAASSELFEWRGWNGENVFTNFK